MTSSQILVVGAGPAGAALSLLLASRGVEVVLLERQLDFAREFRGEVVIPSGMDALHQLGIDEALATVPQRVPTSIELYFRGRQSMSVDLDPGFFGDRMPAAISQPGLLETLVAEADRHPSFRFERGATVKDVLHEGGRCVGVRVRSQAGETEFRAGLVVGKDGRSSLIRKRAGIPARDKAQPMDAVWCKLPLPAGYGDKAPARIFIGHGHLLIAYRSWDDLLQVAWIIQKGTYGELKSRGMDEWVEAMSEHVSPDLAEHFRSHRAGFSRPFLLNVVLDRVEHWTSPGVMLLGDAAHTMSPVGAQGINVALRDSIVAANHLVPACRKGAAPEDLDAAALRVEAERVGEIAFLQRIQGIPPRFMLARTRTAAALRWWLAVMSGSPLARILGPPVMRSFLFGDEVRLRV